MNKNNRHSPPPSEVRCSDPRLISRFPILSCNLFVDGVVPLAADFCCCIWFWDCCCWDVVGFLNDVLNPFEGYNGYYRPAIRTQSLLLSLLLYQIPLKKQKNKRKKNWKLEFKGMRDCGCKIFFKLLLFIENLHPLRQC